MKNTTKKATTAAPVKMTVSKPEQALAVLREFEQNGGTGTSVKLRNNRTVTAATARQIQSWYQTKYNKILDLGWLGRALHSAKSVQIIEHEMDDRVVNLYRSKR